MISLILSKFKGWFFGALAVVVGALAIWGKLMQAKAEKYEQKAAQARKEADDATELSNTHSDLSEAQQQARAEKNDALKNRTKDQPPDGTNFSRDRMHKDRDKN